MIKYLKTLLILFFLLIIAILGSLSFRAIEDFYSYKKALNLDDMKLTRKRFEFFFKKELKYEYLKLKAKDVLDDKNSPLKTFRITLNPKDLKKLNSNLPKSGKKFIDAYLKISDAKKIYKIKLRYRGDNNFHWLYPQKSLRIKLRNSLYDMQREFNLINPPNWYSFRDVVVYNVAKKFGLISPEFYPVRVFINGKFMGVYIFLSQVDESLLRRFKRMPGSIYYGDYGEIDKRGVSNLWFDPNNWKKKAARNAEQKFDRSDINYFIDAINNFDAKKFHSFFNEMANKDKFYTFFALDVIFGSDHHDYHHNHKIYFDPYLGRFEPIEWDLRNWSDEKIKDLSVYPLLNRVRLDPVFEAERDKRAYEILKYFNFSPKAILKEYKDVLEKVKRDLQSDYFRDTAIIDYPLFKDNWVSVPFTMKELEKGFEKDKEILQNRFKFLKDLYENCKISYKISNNKIIFKIEGNSPAKIYTKDEKEIILYPKRKVLKNAQNKRSVFVFGRDLIVNSPAFYEFDLKDFNLKDLKAVNFITGKKLKIRNQNFKTGTISSIFQKKKIKKEIILSGNIDVNQTKIFKENVLIKPGTTFNLGFKKSLYFYGDLKIEANKSSPVVFKPQFPAREWGIVAIFSNNAYIKNIKLYGGSVDLRNLIHFTSPLSVHNVKNFRAENLDIGRNYTGDDAMHIAYSNAKISSSLFHDARSDGLDIDISKVFISKSKFINSGNDGLDVMTTKLDVKDSLFKQNQDKGISVGEWSYGKVENSIFIKNNIGLEIKDKSKIEAKNLTFIDQKSMAIHLYNKNKRYDKGGFLDAKEIALIGNKKVKKDKKSSLKIEFVDKNVTLKKIDYEKYEKEGHIFFAKGDLKKAKECFLKSINLEDDNKTISKRYRYLANVFAKLNDTKNAVENYALSLKYNPLNKNAFYPLKIIFSKVSDREIYNLLLNQRKEIIEILLKNRILDKNILYFNFYEDNWSRGKQAKIVFLSLKNELKRVKFFILNKANVEILEDGDTIFKSFINTSQPQFVYFKAKKGITELVFKTDRVCIPKICGFNNDLRKLGLHVEIKDLDKEEKREFLKGLRYFYQNSYRDHWSRGKIGGVWVFAPKIGEKRYLRYSGGESLKRDIFIKIKKNFHYYNHIKLKPKEIRFEEIGLDKGINFIQVETNSTIDLKERRVGIKYKIVKKIK